MRRRNRTRRWFERLLLLAGMAGLGIWIWSQAGTAVYQDWHSWVFDRQLRGEQATIGQYLAEKVGKTPPAPKRSVPAPAAGTPAPPPAIPEKPPTPENNEVLGRLDIPRLHLSAMVREGVGEDTLRLALGHIPATAFPGEKGNIGVAGHRDTLFRSLRGIRVNDLIRFETLEGSYTYQVQSTEVVGPGDVSVLKTGAYPELTLVTCYPFYYVGSAPDRFIVKARQVTDDAPAAAPSAERQVAANPSPPPSTEVPAPVEKSVEESVEVRPVSKVSKKEVTPSPSGRVGFEVPKDHSRQLAPGISMGVTSTDVADRRVDGWMWVMPDRRTIWLRGQRAKEPLVFYRDGRRRELVITRVSAKSVSGYVVGPGQSR